MKTVCTHCKGRFQQKDIMFSKEIRLNLKSGLVSGPTKFKLALCPVCCLILFNVALDMTPEASLFKLLERFAKQ